MVTRASAAARRGSTRRSSAASRTSSAGSATSSASAAARRGGPQRGADLRYDLEIKFEQAAKGLETHIQIPRQETCETCKGSGAAPGTAPTTCQDCRGAGQLRFQQGFFTVARTCSQCRGAGKVITKPCQTCRGAGTTERTRKLTVKIPAGIATGQRLRLTGEGESGTQGGPSGDLYVVIFVQEHEFFQRDGNDLHCTVPLAFTTLALGGEIKVPGIDGDETVKIPESTQTGIDVPLARQGHARRVRPRPRRHPGDRAGGDAEEAHQGPEAAARAARGHAPRAEDQAQCAR